MKKVRSSKASHTSRSPRGMGDHYGAAIRNPMGRSIDILGISYPKAKVGKAPKSLA